MNKTTGFSNLEPGSFFMPENTKEVTKEHLVAFSDLIDKLERAWYPSEIWDSTTLHPYTSWPISSYILALTTAEQETFGKNYLEVGCGIGVKLNLASKLGWNVSGIEIREQYIAVARYLCPWANIEISDAREYSNYGAFDVIYSYRPLILEESQKELDAFQVSQMKSGAIIISPDRDLSYYNLEFLSNSAWRKP